MTDASSEDFVSGLKEQYGDPGHDKSHPMAPWGGGFLQKGAEYAGAFGRGALKQAALAPGLRAIEPQAILDYANEKDPKHPEVEGWGRYVTPTNVMLGRLPDLPALARVAADEGYPWLIRAGSQFAQNAWKSAAGGAAEADTDTKTPEEAASNAGRGAAEGLGTGIAVTGAQTGLRMLPHWVAPAAIAAGELAHGRFMPWHIRHAIAAGLAALAARAAKVPAGLVGAGGEGAAQQTGNEPGGSQTERPEPF
jgi:hypothetical protein